LKNITDGDSVVSLWIDPPATEASGTIDLAGIMPGGFDGANGPIFSFTLEALAPGTGVIRVARATVLANDGQGTPLPISTESVSVTVDPAPANSAPAIPVAPAVDYTAPNPFTPQIVSDPGIFGGQYFLVFSTTDNSSGIDHYEVLEAPSGSSEKSFSSWHVATSPYLLTDQTLSSDIYVRAVDHDGNFIVVKLPAEHPYAQWGRWGLWTGAAFIVLVVLLLFIWKLRRRRG
jgi:hypothetical protein